MELTHGSVCSGMAEYNIHMGDCLESLGAMPDQSVHCCVTSPPYFGLRDYGLPTTDWPEIEFIPMPGLPPITIPAMSCCLGLEPEPWAFVGHMVAVFRQVRRILADDGTLWLNLGDSYARNPAKGQHKPGQSGGKNAYVYDNGNGRASSTFLGDGIKEKDLLGIPWRVAYALQADGWYLRQDIIWQKPNPMPESVTDRCTKSHEYVFLLSKAPRYYFDSEAVREDAVGGQSGKAASFKRDNSQRAQAIPGQGYGTHRPDRDDISYNGDKRNIRSVWTVPTRAYKGAHFATFPPALIEPCILAGCPIGGTVLDPFGGSGTTAGVAIAHGRQAVLCELNHDYGDMVPARIESILAAYGKPVKKPRIKLVANDNAPEQKALFS